MGQRVLVIDDVEDVLIVATLSLEASGYVALTAHDGIEGLEVAQASWPDLIHKAKRCGRFRSWSRSGALPSPIAARLLR